MNEGLWFVLWVLVIGSSCTALGLLALRIEENIYYRLPWWRLW
jgi:hypothetical protein